MRGPTTLLLGLCLALSFLPSALAGPQPGLHCDASEGVHGRVFAEPEESTDFIGFDEALCGLAKLEERYEDRVAYFEVARSVGWTNTLTMEKDQFPVVAVEVTDESVSEKKGSLVFITSVHGNEKGAREAMLRVIEDLAHGDLGIAGDVASVAGKDVDAVLSELRFVFVFPNPDGWVHEEPEYRLNDACYVSVTCGAASEPGEIGVETQWFVRVNGNGTDLNRQYPTTGVPHPTIPPLSEPEGKGTVTYLKSLPEPVIAGADLHGMLNADNLVFLLQKDTQRTVLEFFQDEAVAQLSDARIDADETASGWEATGGETTIWGPTIDLLGYSAPGTGGAFIVQDAGLDAAGFTVEMAYSHITFDNHYQGPGQVMNVLQVAALRQLVAGFVEYAYNAPGAVAFEGESVIGVVPHPTVVPAGRHDGTDADPNALFAEMAEAGADVRMLSSLEPASLEGLTHVVLLDDADAAKLAVLEPWVEAGGTLLLTDQAAALAVDLGLATGVRAQKDFTGRVHQDHDHALTAGLPIPLRTLVDGNPLGYDAGTVPIACLEGFSGTTAGARAVESEGPPVPGVSEPVTCTVVGEAPLGEGTVRVVGALFPAPRSPGPNGVDGYALTPNGARVLFNALDLTPSTTTAIDPGEGSSPTEGASDDIPFVPALVALAILAVAALVGRRG